MTDSPKKLRPKKRKIVYALVPVPTKDEKVEPKTYSYTVRRAEILGMIKTAGSPGAISPTQLAKRYGKTHSQICQDIAILKDELLENFGKGIKVKSELLFQKVIADLMEGDNRDKYHAAKIMKEWLDFLFDLGVMRKEPERIEAIGDPSVVFIVKDDKDKYPVIDIVKKEVEDDTTEEEDSTA